MGWEIRRYTKEAIYQGQALKPLNKVYSTYLLHLGPELIFGLHKSHTTYIIATRTFLFKIAIRIVT